MFTLPFFLNVSAAFLLRRFLLPIASFVCWLLVSVMVADGVGFGLGVSVKAADWEMRALSGVGGFRLREEAGGDPKNGEKTIDRD